MGTEGKFLNLIKGNHTQNFTSNIILSERLSAFLQRLGTRQYCLILLLLFNIALEVLRLDDDHDHDHDGGDSGDNNKLRATKLEKKKYKTVLFIDDVVLFVENLKKVHTYKIY